MDRIGYESEPDRLHHWMPPVLTAREHEVLLHLAQGLTNKEIAAALGVSEKTVMHHSMAIYRKLGVRGRAAATAFAYRSGIVG